MELALPVGPRDHVRGPRDAPVTVVMYGDVQCPYCGRVKPVLRQLLERRPVRMAFRHFPLIDVHPFAYSAALALEAAAEAGRFWELHDRLYADQERQGRAQAPLQLDRELRGRLAFGMEVSFLCLQFVGDEPCE